ncbi:FliM/FliN family flagellar motor C-terminal domain-containing protein [Shimia sp. SDUM112013]|uniref:FliM/FliN family flagellar motor C-terminal domain-containing protein n=1 Tax=Shimia sp. SDUM112013 TaxID=3136160 RepID=UPI0032EB17C8
MPNSVSSPFGSVPINITVSVGKARPSIGDLLELKPNTVLHLDKKVDDPVELYIGERLIAKGHLEQQDDSDTGQLVVRLTEISNIHDGTL